LEEISKIPETEKENERKGLQNPLKKSVKTYAEIDEKRYSQNAESKT
jgi:hypothetical protein